MSAWFTAHSFCTLPAHSSRPCKHIMGYSFTDSFSLCNMSGTRCIRRSGYTYFLTKERLMSTMSHVSLSVPSRTASHTAQQCVRAAAHHAEHDGYTGVVVWDRHGHHR